VEKEDEMECLITGKKILMSNYIWKFKVLNFLLYKLF
jgi:hypothetical protein